MRRGSMAASAASVAGIVLVIAVGVALASSPPPSADPSAAVAASAEPSESVQPSEPGDASAEPSSPSPAASAASPSPAASAASPSPAASAEASPSTDRLAEPTGQIAPASPQEDDDGPIATLTGMLRVVTEADGDKAYYIGDTRLSVGPPWFWGDRHPLAGFVGDTITVTGRADQGPGPKANARANASPGPKFDVFTVNGSAVREPGKPPWAGGPKVVGASHPGYAGWSRSRGTPAGS